MDELGTHDFPIVRDIIQKTPIGVLPCTVALTYWKMFSESVLPFLSGAILVLFVPFARVNVSIRANTNASNTYNNLSNNSAEAWPARTFGLLPVDIQAYYQVICYSKRDKWHRVEGCVCPRSEVW